MSPATLAFFGTVVTAAVAIVTVVIQHGLTRRREIAARDAEAERADRLRRIELSLKRAERQIDEFYGPIHALIQHILMADRVKTSILEKLDPADNQPKDPEAVKAEIDDFLREKYFFPLHAEIRAILKDRLHLLSGTEMPDGFRGYLEHATMENIQNRLWLEKGIRTLSVPGIPWDERFEREVKKGLDEAMNAKERTIAELTHAIAARGTP